MPPSSQLSLKRKDSGTFSEDEVRQRLEEHSIAEEQKKADARHRKELERTLAITAPPAQQERHESQMMEEGGEETPMLEQSGVDQKENQGDQMDKRQKRVSPATFPCSTLTFGQGNGHPSLATC